MSLFRATLKLESALGTPLAGPTLFGQLCWIKHEMKGEAELETWLSNEDNLWKISDGFPHGYLPKPLVHPDFSRQKNLETKDLKTRKKCIYVRRNVWLDHRDNWDEYTLVIENFIKEPVLSHRLAHNTIDRHGRGTVEEGGLFFLDEDWRFAKQGFNKIDIYIEASQKDKDEIWELLTLLGNYGFGRDASTGRGRWQVEDIVEDMELASGTGQRLMSLSRGVLTPETMHNALWQIVPHFGRTGPQLSLTGISAFKRPVLLTRPGTSFSKGKSGAFGKILKNIHPDRKEIVLNGLHIAIPFSEAGLMEAGV